MKSKPAVSVVMPVYNSVKYLAEAIESILNQTFSDFEFLIFDDGSTDGSAQIIKNYAAEDSRILAKYSSVNAGYVKHLNDGIVLARAPYLARMDSDDIALPRRLELQKEFLDRHPEIGVVGSSSIRIDQDGRELGLSRRHSAPSYLFWQSFFVNPLAHPTVMYRETIFDSAEGYRESKSPAEDYDLWTRVSTSWHLANIEEPLLKYREHNNSVSVLRRETQVRNFKESLAALWWDQLKIEISGDEILFLKGYHKGYDDLPPEMAYVLFCKISLLRREVLARFRHVDLKVDKEFFRRGVYLASKTKKKSWLEFNRLTGSLLARYPFFMIRYLVYGCV